MTRRRQKTPPLKAFVAITWELLISAAFIELCHYSRAALPYFLGKVKLSPADPRKYTTPFSFPYSEAKRLGFPTSTFAKAIEQLVKYGFLDPVSKGGCYGEIKAPNEFTLSNRWRSYGTKEFVASSWKSFIPKPRKNTPRLYRGKCITPSGEINPDTS